MAVYLLYESAAGYSLFEKLEVDEVSSNLTQIQKNICDFEKFSKMVKLKAMLPFTTAEMALNNMKSIAESEVTDDLKNFLETELLSKGKKQKISLACQDVKFAGNVSTALGINGTASNLINELYRGIRLHFTKFLKKKDFSQGDLDQAALGLGHAYSRNKVSMDIARQDKHIIQTISLLEQFDKNLNQFCMRIKEWYSWHFPELAKIVSDNHIYIKLVYFIQNKESLTEESIPKLEEITTDSDIARKIYDASKSSMGQEFSEIDQATLISFCERIVKGFEYRNSLQQYLKDRMTSVAPSLTAFIGENVGAKLICQAGSLVNLAKYPASTVQILGAEKALFRALKTKGNTPKYGTLYHSGYIGKALAKDKGKISRYIANKCSLAARIDQFALIPTTKFGEKMKEQVEERLKFLEKGEKTQRNVDVMKSVLDELKSEGLYVESEDKLKKKKKKKKQSVDETLAGEEKPKKKVKPNQDEETQEEQPKRKKSKTADEEEVEEQPKVKKGKAVVTETEEEEKPKKKKGKVVEEEPQEEEKPRKKKAKASEPEVEITTTTKKKTPKANLEEDEEVEPVKPKKKKVKAE